MGIPAAIQWAEQHSAIGAVVWGGPAGSDSATGGVIRKRREGVARPKFPAEGGAVLSPRGPFFRARLWLRRKLSPFISRIWT